jgi:hypothetical protein
MVLWATTSSSGVLDNVLQASPFLSTHLTFLLTLTLYSSHVSRCFVRVTCPIHLFIQSEAIEPLIHPINYVLVVWVGLASRRHLQVVWLVFILSGWESYHMLNFMDICCWRYSWLTLMLIIKIELSRGIGESFCQFYDGSPVSPRTPRSHELFWDWAL